MKVTYNWLKDYVDFDWTPEELADRLTFLGLEVEGIAKVGNEFEGIVIAEVLTREQHPQADKLSVCQVSDGQETRQIVCGAQNFKAGDKVPLILPGSTLPPRGAEDAFTIKVNKIRGIRSHGMMCSGQELGLSEDHSGLMILPPEAPVGQPFGDYLGKQERDVVYDLEITPNRPDLNSLIGVAREIAALTGNPLKQPDFPSSAPAKSNADTAPATRAAADCVRVELADPDGCPRYTARIVHGVSVAPSPDWLRSRLEKVGIRSINNIVDATNYVLMETGQPLHAFDYHLLSRPDSADSLPGIIVRRAQGGELFTTLDGQERELSDDMLVIADEKKAIALAGVMGGLNTEIQDDTRDVLIESAYFDPSLIRRTAKTLGLRTEASYRFERGADIGMASKAGLRCAELILAIAGGTLADDVVDAYPKPHVPHEITLRPEKVGALLGVDISTEEIVCHLSQLGLQVGNKRRPTPVDAPPSAQPETIRVGIPSFRVDLKGEIDLIEEVVRLHGVDTIPATPPRGAIGNNPFDAIHDCLNDARRLLVGLGLYEAQGQTLISRSASERISQPALALDHPLSSDMSVLRPSLLPGLLDALRHNVNHKNERVALFEIGRVFTATPKGPGEERRLAIALTGPRSPVFWEGSDRDRKSDLYDLKGILEEFLDHFDVRGVQYSRKDDASELFAESASLSVGKNTLGEMGQVPGALAEAYDLRDPVLLAELNLETLFSVRTRGRSFKTLPLYPSVRRDVAMIVSEDVTHELVLKQVKKARPEHLERVDLFDIFRGGNIGKGKKSVAYAFTYRSGDRTLTDDEVVTEHAKVVARLKDELCAAIRD